MVGGIKERFIARGVITPSPFFLTYKNIILYTDAAYNELIINHKKGLSFLAESLIDARSSIPLAGLRSLSQKR
jgi:hypothetical protein